MLFSPLKTLLVNFVGPHLYQSDVHYVCNWQESDSEEEDEGGPSGGKDDEHSQGEDSVSLSLFSLLTYF